MAIRATRARVTTTATVLLAGTVLASCGGGDSASGPRSGREVYEATCLTCHGADGQGGVGPALVDVAERYPDIEDQIAVVANGTGRMPSFRGALSAAEIRRVVEYERTELRG